MRDPEVLLGKLAPVGPNGFRIVIACATKQLHSKFLLDLGGPVASRLKPSFFTSRAPGIRAGISVFRRPVKPNWNSSTQRLRNVLAHKRRLLPTVDVAIDLLRIAHGGTITSKGRPRLNKDLGQVRPPSIAMEPDLSGLRVRQVLSYACILKSAEVYFRGPGREPGTVESSEMQEALERGPLFDSAIIRHGFTPYLRDYDIVIYHGRGLEYLYRFSHCPFAEVTTAVAGKDWKSSWDDVFTDYSEWLKSGSPDGYVWGICESEVYPGAKYIRDSILAQEWTSKLGNQMHEVLIETNAYNIRLVFHDLSVKELLETDPEWLKQPVTT